MNFFRGGMHALIGVDIVVFSFHCHIQVWRILVWTTKRSIEKSFNFQGDYIHRHAWLKLADSQVVCQVMPIFAELADEPNPFFHEGWNWGLREPLLSTENEAPILQKGSSRVKCMDGVILISMTTCFIGYCLVQWSPCWALTYSHSQTTFWLVLLVTYLVMLL